MFADLLHDELPADKWGNKAARLSIVAQMHQLSVPPAFCMLYSQARRLTRCQALDAWLNVYQPRTVVIRMSSILEDTKERAHAGKTMSISNCPPEEQAILRVLHHDLLPASEPWSPGGNGLSFMIQQQVRTSVAGVVFATVDNLWVECSRKSTHAVTSGEEPDVRIESSHNRVHAQGDVGSMPTITLVDTLKSACHQLRRTFGFNIDVEWLWNAGSLSILQVRPLTVTPEVDTNEPNE